MADATATLGDTHYVVALLTGRHELTADEPVARG
jgi:hypothetical protein